MTFQLQRVEPLDKYSANAFFSCPSCRKPSAAQINADLHGKQSVEITQLEGSWPRSLRDGGYLLKEMYPQPISTAAPESVPDNVRRNFVQAEEARVRKHRETAGMAYRRTLELALKDIAPELKGTLEKRIDKLAEQSRLTPDLAEWAHSVRELGNEATHDAPEPSAEDVIDLASFTKVVLEYLYTMPAKVRARSPQPGVDGK
jgi:hypothetical protein